MATVPTGQLVPKKTASETVSPLQLGSYGAFTLCAPSAIFPNLYLKFGPATATVLLLVLIICSIWCFWSIAYDVYHVTRQRPTGFRFAFEFMTGACITCGSWHYFLLLLAQKGVL